MDLARDTDILFYIVNPIMHDFLLLFTWFHKLTMAAASKRLLNETAPTGSNHVSLYGARNETYNS